MARAGETPVISAALWLWRKMGLRKSRISNELLMPAIIPGYEQRGILPSRISVSLGPPTFRK